MAFPSRHIALRTHEGVLVTDFDASHSKIEALCCNETQMRSFVYSPDGAMIALVLPSCIRILSVPKSQVLVELPVSNVIEVEFSPRGTYIATWERMIRSEDHENLHKNLKIWESVRGNQAAAFTQKSQTGWNIQWTETETYFARLVTNEIHVYNPTNPATITEKIRLEGVNAFSISPGKRSVVATFVPEKKGASATVQLFELGLGLGSNQQALASKSFFRADSCTFYWNKLGTNVIAFTHTDVDATGKSYYGETHLYYLSIAGNYNTRVDLVVYGTMPARATLFDHRANPVYQFGSGPRNFVKYSPGGRIICLAGFGNLSGEMDFWDRKTCVKISSVQASNSSTCEWAPDGRHVMTSTLYKRLKVDNGIKVWHYTGVLVHKFEVKELHQAAWRPFLAGLWDEGGALDPPPQGIPEEVKPQVAKVGAYRPPGARAAGGTASTFTQLLNHERESPSSLSDSNMYRQSSFSSGSAVVGAAPSDDKLAKAAMKNKKKRDNKKHREDGFDGQSLTSFPLPSHTNGGSGALYNGVSSGVASPSGKVASSLSPNAPSFTPAVQKSENEKKIKTINRKLQGIAEIREMIAKGENVEKNQLSKLEVEGVLRAQLGALMVEQRN
ncbi:hypothetical protein SeMB42_g01137 [Synchytrium endobioticum]|uniref:Eukaryotic translation initiation factor 2A n=1 Tax=Synchytrium endobioticum TaxID=286115 RepID=A0A507DML3_9FUNG|nr:hypothetical protein SeMB42_g01137 [Synchytrium endobioticum]